MTTLAGVRIATFTVTGTTLDYHRLPIRDDLVPISDGLWHGTGRLAGFPFCSFRLVKEP
jgi:hypothetical protein